MLLGSPIIWNYSGGSRCFENVSAVLSFSANAHNEIYAFYTGIRDLLKKNSEANRGRTPPQLPS